MLYVNYISIKIYSPYKRRDKCSCGGIPISMSESACVQWHTHTEGMGLSENEH